MSLLTKSSRIYNTSLRSASQTFSGLTQYTGDTLIFNIDTQYVPSIVGGSVINCTATISTTNGSTPTSTTLLVITLGNSSGTFNLQVQQNYSNRQLNVSGTVPPASYSGGPLESMSMGGDDLKQSINVELGLSATNTIELGGSAARGLAGVSSGAIDIEDFYGQEVDLGPFNLPVTSTFNATVGTDTDIPALTSGNTQISSTSSMWRRMRLTNTGASATLNLYVRGQRDGNATFYYGDMQIAAYVVDADGSNETVNTLDTPSGVMSGWKTRQTMYAQTDTTWTASTQGNPHYTVTDANGNTSLARNGQLNIMTTNRVTTSSGTGRLSNLAANYNGASNLGYGFFETSVTANSAPYIPSTNAYYHALSPSFYLNNGDYLDIYYGVDCPSWQEVRFELL